MSRNVYQMVTDRIISELENGQIPWSWDKPWGGTFDRAYNRISKKPYSLLNQLLLKHKYGEYATLKQWNELGGKIRKGEKAEFVVFWKINEYTEKNADGEDVKRVVPILRYYNVFHISQVDNVTPLDRPSREHEPIAEAEKVLYDYINREGILFEECITDEAYYSPSRDLVHVPSRQQYQRIEEFWSTTYHEICHSTGHSSRLNRLDGSAKSHFGSDIYSVEELTVELGSAMILNILGIETAHSFKNSNAYIQNWLQVLRNDNKFVVSASVRAEKAVEYILHGKQTADANTQTST